MSRVSCCTCQSAMRSAGAMSAAQGVLALTMLSLLVSSCSASHRNSSSSDRCTADITDADAYKIEHPICSRLAKISRARIVARCASVRGRPMNVTLYWSNDPSRAASALLAALLRHVYKFQRVHLAPEGTHLSQLHNPDELVISLAAVVPDEAAEVMGVSTEVVPSHVPTRRRLHAWLTPAARLIDACQHTNWTFYTNLTARALCGFLVPSPRSSIAMDVLCVGDDCNATMQKLQQRAESTGTPARAVFVNRTDFKNYLLISNHSFLFLDFDMWSGEPNVSVVVPPPCVSNRKDGGCKPELDYSTGMLVTDSNILKDNVHLYAFVTHFKPTPESLRVLLAQEANRVNLEEAACDWTKEAKSYFKVVATCLCKADPDNVSYNSIVNSNAVRVFKGMLKRPFDILYYIYYINCSDTYNMSRKLDYLMEQSFALNLLGVVSLTVEGAAAASAAAAAHRVPLLLARVVPDEHATGNTTWQAAGRLRHIALALQHFVNESGQNSVAVLTQPTTFAKHYFAALQDKAKFLLRYIEIPLDLTERLAKEALRDLQYANTRVVVVNTDSNATTLILAAAVELKMTYTDGFIWIVREPRTKPECCTTHFTVSLNKVMKDNSTQLSPPHRVPLADALMTVSSGLIKVFQEHWDMLIDLHSDQVIRAFDDSLKGTPVTGLNGVQLHYKERVLEEAFVYVVCHYYGFKHQRLATWRVNATSGSVSDMDGTRATLRLDLSVKPDEGAKRACDRAVLSDADGDKNHRIVTDKSANTSNPVFIVHQWIEFVTKILFLQMILQLL